MAKKTGKNKSSFFLFVLLSAFAFFSFFIDGALPPAIQYLSSPIADVLFGIISNPFVVIFLFLILPAIALLSRQRNREAMVLCLAFLASAMIGLSLKLLIARPRPESLFVFADALRPSFPSLHALLVFALLPLLVRSFPRLRVCFRALAILVGFTRLYFGVHYLSDVLFGALIGYAIGWYMVQQKVEISAHSALLPPGKRFEWQRKLLHIALGLLLVLFIQENILKVNALGILVFLAFALSLLERKRRIPLFSSLLDTFERQAVRKYFPAKGLLFFLAGSFLSVLFFPKDIALASIMALALGDSISHLFGIHFGKVVHPLADKKFLEGAIAGFVAAFFGALLFVSPIEALAASFAAMLIEALEVKVRKIQVDDNLLIPLAAGGAIVLLRAFS